MDGHQELPIPKELWETIPVAAQAALLAVFERMDRQIAQLQAENVELKARVAELEARLNQNSQNSSKPPSTEPVGKRRRPPEPPSGRKRGGQQGHQRHSRPLVPPERVSKIVDHLPSLCRQCGHQLAGSDPQPLRHQVAELPPIEPTVEEHRLHRLTCSHCGTPTRAELPGDVPHGSFGPRLQAILALLSGGYRISKRGVQQLAKDVLGLSISTGMIAKLEQSTSRALQQPVEELGRHIRTQHVNVDETSWKENRKKAYLWVAVSQLATVFLIAPTRGAKAAKSLLGIGYNMVATCDRYSGYLWVDRRQLCWAHLRRDFQAMIDRRGLGKPIGEALLAHSDALFEWWHNSPLKKSRFSRNKKTLRRLGA